MSNDWILDVLADLHSFAEQNGLPALAAEIVRTRDVAAVEIASRAAEKAKEWDEGATTTGPNPGWVACGRHA